MFKRVLIFFLIMLSSSLLFAEESLPSSDDYFFTSDIPVTYGDEGFRERILARTTGERDPIGLVLTGGSARAIAHLGVLAYLEENGIIPDFIISNSMGSIIALLYAAGLEPEQIAEFLMIGDLSNYFNVTLPLYGGLLDPTGFKSLVESVVGEDLRLEDLNIPVMVVCDDLVTKREIRIAEGDFADVLIASFALPVYFPPMEYNGHLLLDGGVKTLAPISIAYEYSDTVVISTTFYDLDTLNLLNPITILNSAFDVGKRQKAASDMKSHPGYIWIRCNVEQFSFMDFAAAEEMLVIGHESAKAQSEALNKLYKSGTDEFDELRASYRENIERARNNLYYFNRVETNSISNILSLGYKSYQGDDTYLNEEFALGVEYRLRYRMVEMEAIIGYAFNTHSSTFDKDGLIADLAFNIYPLQRLRFSFEGNATWYSVRWTPSVYVRQGMDFRLLMIPDTFSLSLREGFEYFRTPDDMRTHDSTASNSIYLFNTAFDLNYEMNPWQMDASLGYMFTSEKNVGDFRQYIEFNMDNRFSLPLSFFLEASVFTRIAIDGRTGVPIFFRDGFESNVIDPWFGYRPEKNEAFAVIINLSAGYALPVSPTIAEFLIFDDTEFSAYFDMYLNGLLFNFSTGVDIQTRMSLIGLIDLPVKIRLGYDSISKSFLGSLLFTVDY